jgi:hypothetical protein
MKKGLAAAVAVATLVTALGGCGGSSATGAAGTAGAQGNGGNSITVDVPTGGAGVSLPPIEGWPATAPADVPSFPGRLDSLMPQRAVESCGIRARMFFRGVSRDGFFAYVQVLRANGYQIKGTVFYSEQGGKSEAERRAAMGDVDEIAATKGTRVLVVAAPASADEVTTFDLCGLTQAESDALGGGIPVIPTPDSGTDGAGGTWPAAWAERLPQPKGCTLVVPGAASGSLAAMNARCTYPDADPAHHQEVVKAYEKDLVAAGFTVTSENNLGGEIPGGLAMVSLEKGPIRLSILVAGPANSMSINAIDTEATPG